VPTGLNLLPSDGEAYLVNDSLSPAEADRYLDLLRDRIDWRQESARLMGRALPRMINFALWATAAESAFGWPEGAFLEAYRTNRAEAATATSVRHWGS